MNRLTVHIRQHLIGYTALVLALLALGGSSYAALSVPAGSVGPRQLDQRLIGGYVLAWAHVNADGRAVSGSRGARATREPGGPTNVIGYSVRWKGQRLPANCALSVTLGDNGASTGTYAVAGFVTAGKGPHEAAVTIYNSAGQRVAAPFYLTVVC